MNALGRLLSYPELKAEKGIRFSRQHLHRLSTAGKFPKPIKLGEATNAFSEVEVDNWLAAKAAERDGSGSQAA